ncbi:UDP-N-acetylmuramoyl-tripeptide--D-alanyl-D-alanine ligase [Corynebacterium renale]|uniref:UDP-N-acetylmuramoyl-tripeptide--D-alanyl-D- alanine ligase n=1 Tax=Corynebacterium renale TaxID=1724 RepID=UPI000652B6C4|nr:UDP-N-acetylmuramoyl-tripeptide--D-alanyl-D-alanine ligase [Corynebacterium renale]
MIELSLREIADIVGGTLVGGADPDAAVTGNVEFDSRKIGPGDLFIAAAGGSVDGHDFVRQAVEKHGAVAAIVTHDVGMPAILVAPQGRSESTSDVYAHDEDGSMAAAIDALSALAREVIDRLAADGLTVVGVTGSAGKTSTKDLLASVLSQAGPTVAPPGSFNNELGHPYTALRCTPETSYLVAEMSARGIGHIAHLAQIAPPRIGVELNVGSAHVGEFGSRENIAVAKGELVEALPDAGAGGIAVLNADDPFVAGMAPRTEARTLWYSAGHPVEGAPKPDVWATDITVGADGCAEFSLNTADGITEIALGIAGEHQVANALAAATGGLAVGLDLATVAQALCEHRAVSPHRMATFTRNDGVTIIDDAYNANPESMRAGIESAVQSARSRAQDYPNARVYAVLGPMGELGSAATTAHRELGQWITQRHVAVTIGVGEDELSHALVSGVTANSSPGVTGFLVADKDAAVRYLHEHIRPGDVVLVKASNASHLWEVAEALNTSVSGA